MVFINFDKFAGTDYAFYADPSRDIVDIAGAAPAEVQYPRNAVTTDATRGVAEFYSNYLSGGLSQVTIRASLRRGAETTTAAKSRLRARRGYQPEMCAAGGCDPSTTAGNKGSSTSCQTEELLAELRRGQKSQQVLAGVSPICSELYRRSGACVREGQSVREYEIRRPCWTALLGTPSCARSAPERSCPHSHPALCDGVSGLRRLSAL